MTTTHAQVQFAAEFVTLMVAASGLALAVLRSEPNRRARRRPGIRLLVALGCAIVGTAAFLHGSRLVSDRPPAGLSVARLVGAAILALSVSAWSGGRRTALVLQAGVGCWAAAAVAELAQASNWVVDGLLVAGSLGIGVALLVNSRHSIAARVAASGAATVLLVILVLAVALSAVISSSLQRDALNRLNSRAQTESAQVGDTVNAAGKDARFVAAYLQVDFKSANPNPLITYASSPATAPVAAARQAIQNVLQQVAAYYPVGGFAYADPTGTNLAATVGIDPTFVRQLARDPTFAHLTCNGQQPGTVFVSRAGASAAAAYPVCLANTNQLLGTVITITPLGPAYLNTRVPIDPSVALALVTQQSVVASAGRQPPTPTLVAFAGQPDRTEARGNDFLAAVPVAVAHNSPPLAVVLSTPSTTLVSTQNQLYRTLFLIALGGTILALGLAAFTGDRITAGLRRLTQVADRIQGGNTSERAYIAGDDEVATLGLAFDSMIDSVEEQAGALQAAADDETRLRNRLEAVVAGMTDALVAVDARGLITDFNQAAEGLLAVAADAAFARQLDDVLELVDEDGAAMAGRLLDIAAPPWSRLAAVRRPDGVEVPVAVSSGALRGPAGEVAGRVLVVRDLRREREVEQMKTEFLSRVGHELRTPLTGIMGYADILLRRDIPADRARAWHDEILQAGRRLLRIVEMLEFFASSGAGRVLLRPEPLDTRALINGVTSSWSERLPADVTLGRRVARDTPPVFADRRWLTMAIDELIDNAVKFSPDGGRILVAAAPAAPEAATGGNGRAASARLAAVEISVTDRGVGMTPEEHALVFSDFVQADGSDTRRFGGLGLGLAVVRRVVEGHGGVVTCRSVPGRGTTFIIRLPATAPAGVIPHSDTSPVLG